MSRIGARIRADHLPERVEQGRPQIGAADLAFGLGCSLSRLTGVERASSVGVRPESITLVRTELCHQRQKNYHARHAILAGLSMAAQASASDYCKDRWRPVQGRHCSRCEKLIVEERRLLILKRSSDAGARICQRCMDCLPASQALGRVAAPREHPKALRAPYGTACRRFAPS